MAVDADRHPTERILDRLGAAGHRLAGLWVGTTERRKMAILWLLGVATTPTMLTTISPWTVVVALPFRILGLAWTALGFALSLPFRPGVLLGALGQVIINKVALFLNLAIADPPLAVAYSLGPVVAAVVWVKLGGWAWRAARRRGAPAEADGAAAE